MNDEQLMENFLNTLYNEIKKEELITINKRHIEFINNNINKKIKIESNNNNNNNNKNKNKNKINNRNILSRSHYHKKFITTTEEYKNKIKYYTICSYGLKCNIYNCNKLHILPSIICINLYKKGYCNINNCNYVHLTKCKNVNNCKFNDKCGYLHTND